jgi:hypothetical protein
MAEMRSETTPAHHGHETHDVDLRFMVLFGICLVLLLAGSLALMAWMLEIFEVMPEAQGVRGAPLSPAPPRPPGPQLQTLPARDMQEMLRADNARLQSYAWVDRAAGIARIPIDRAMELVLQQGLPSWQDIPTARPDERAPAQEKSR